jgi:hypothetical protein
MSDVSLAWLFRILRYWPKAEQWIRRKFGRLEVTPINRRGANLFVRRDEKSTFRVKIRFYLRATTDMDLLDIDFTYGPGFIRANRYGWIDDDELSFREGFQLAQQRRLTGGFAHHVVLGAELLKKESARDHDKVTIHFETNAPSVNGIEYRDLELKLEPAGELHPGGTHRL